MDSFIILLSILLLLIVSYLQHVYSYWKNHNIPQYHKPFPPGNFLNINSIHLGDLMCDIYTKFKGKTKIVGTYIFTKPIAVILDLDLVKTILIKDFNKFIDRMGYRNEEKDPISGHLFNLYGEKWRNLRRKLTPTFSSGKMKSMFPTIMEVAKDLELAFEQKLRDCPDGVLEVYDIVGRFTTDVIGSCAFGLQCNSLKNADGEFRSFGRLIFNANISSIRWRIFQETYVDLFKYLGFQRHSKSIEHFIMRVVRETIAMREKENINRNDFISLLIEMRNSKDMNGMPGLTIEEIGAQVFLFFAAGFETSSSNISFGLFEMAKNQAVQDKVRAEIIYVLKKHNGQLSYDATMEMTYLDQVITETSRKYPALAALTRIAEENYTIPGTKMTLEKGTKVYIPIKEIHNDPDIYENPEEFRPERFDPDELKLRHSEAFLGFGDGPRNCIGLRFGRMQARIGLITLLLSFKFTLNERTPKQNDIGKKSIVLTPANGILLKVDKL